MLSKSPSSHAVRIPPYPGRKPQYCENVPDPMRKPPMLLGRAPLSYEEPSPPQMWLGTLPQCNQEVLPSSEEPLFPQCCEKAQVIWRVHPWSTGSAYFPAESHQLPDLAKHIQKAPSLSHLATLASWSSWLKK